jgi:hypothetical protein
MRQSLLIVLVLVTAIAVTAPLAWAGNGWGGTDDWGGFRWARDDDGDGIPNGQDPDWLRPKDGSGYGSPWTFVGPMLLGSFGDSSQTRTRNEWRYMNRHDSNALGDRLRLHERLQQRLRDGSCED